MISPQVSRSHYAFGRYMHKRRWASLWHQLDEVIRSGACTVLEIGPGIGLFKAVGNLFGLRVSTLDIDPELQPDHVASVFDMPLPDSSVDAVVAFQMLEHLPYERSLEAFREMARVAEKHVIISLPDAREMWFYSIYIPKVGDFRFMLPKPVRGAREHVFDGQHYWEVNKRGYELSRVLKDFTLDSLRLVRTYRVAEFAYHRFFIFEKLPGDAALS